MKKSKPLHWLPALVLLCIISSFAPVEHGVYVQLHPNSNKKIVIQIVPDKTYANVVAYVNFYAANNKRVGQQAYSLSDDKDKYVRKDKCTTRIFKFSFDETVTRVKIDHVNEDEMPGKDDDGTKGKKISLPVSDHALGDL
jgi:hypothetical protein